MDVLRQCLFLLSGIGAINGLLLSLYYLFAKKNIATFERIFGLLLFALTIRVGKSVYLYFIDDSTKIILQIGLSFGLFIGPLLFFFCYNIIHKNRRVPPVFYLLAGVLACIIISLGLIIPYEQFSRYWNDYVIYFVYLIWLVGILSTWFLLFKKWNVIQQMDRIDRQWMYIIVIMNTLILIFYQAALFFKFKSYIFGPMIFSLSFYLLTFWEFRRINKAKKERKINDARVVDEAFAQKLLLACSKIMEENELYKNPKLKVKDLSDAIGYKPHDVSLVLNEQGTNFSDFVNGYRIEIAKTLIHERKDLTMEGIGYEAGFSSKSTFYAVFKKLTGKTPTSFMKNE